LACKPARHLYIEPLSLGLPKRLAVSEVANHLVCSVCGARNDELKRPIHVRPDARVPGEAAQTHEAQLRTPLPVKAKGGIQVQVDVAAAIGFGLSCGCGSSISRPRGRYTTVKHLITSSDA
jgi:hypothetical protein